MLQVENLNAWYGRSHVLQGIDLNVEAGEIVALIGRNGAGKTTTLRAIMGLLARSAGAVHFDGVEISGRAPHERFHMGLGYVPEERRIVPGLTVRENLRLGLLRSGNRGREAEVIDGIAKRFPRLGERLSQEAITMSGGEQQMLAIARAMVSGPKLIMLDEPTEGIMPVLVDEMFELFSELKNCGTTIVLVEQNVEMALEVADRAYIMDQGTIVHQGVGSALLADREIQERYCTV
ncbi:MAG: ABC transporter ATP-binding protein [Lautropia sp.]|nr:MAG: ABC transporter ATP-binding protein [Pseudomonadota bacterium]MBC6958955.1 ABC transporter ATP-binding protein [Lautropia sp.]MCL4701103.1 ABC transporter ATP-binding protein [Burkholderiaceae bacterium]MDL1908692.1 ABC transporter ATP-binding protein [Betaproteobacteria bacterium PRO1]RIK90481.1 MAG: ABC transporter ATP-binding protein [Burkholderiales bacterium]